MDVRTTHLLTYLKAGDGIYAAKLLELRDAITEWLNYIPNTFPHYTRHTVGHSEQIIAQLSSLLFHEDGSPTTRLSHIEAYILCVAAYLHDAGMVCADDEKSAFYNLMIGLNGYQAAIQVTNVG